MKKPAADRILMFLKTRGEATSLLIAEELSITKEGARKHLLNLAEEGLIEPTMKSEGGVLLLIIPLRIKAWLSFRTLMQK
jgi:predicted ArsR family transcriptional regulator